MMSVPQFDPLIVRFLGEHEPFQQFVRRLYAVLLGDTDPMGPVPAAMLREPSPPASCIHWLPTSTTTPRADLLRTTRRILNLPVE